MTVPRRSIGSRIGIHIERLVVDGADLGPGGAERMRRALVAELERLLQQARASDPGRGRGGGPGSRLLGEGHRRIDGGAISWAPEHGPVALGRQVAGALHRGLYAGRTRGPGSKP